MTEGLASNILSKDFIIHSANSKEEICLFVNSEAKRLYWPFLDPANKLDSPEESINRFRKVRNEIN